MRLITGHCFIICLPLNGAPGRETDIDVWARVPRVLLIRSQMERLMAGLVIWRRVLKDYGTGRDD